MSSATTTTPAGKTPAGTKRTKADDPEQGAKAVRETIESVVIAIILAFLFRTFEAEAFVIPTGSMAPTLQGRHKDVECPQCHYRYRTGASQEEQAHRDDPSRTEVVGTLCPICGYALALDPLEDPNQASFTGDRILVSKFAYQIAEPQRWDAIVFKYPGNAKQNYIKRLIGLPNERVKIYHGDIFVQKPDEPEETIARKPPYKLRDTLQIVDDTQHLPETLVNLKWPSRWQTWLAPDVKTPAKWTMTADGKSFATTGDGGEAWLRYKHMPPWASDWDAMRQGKLPADLAGLDPVAFTTARDRLITDFCTYNDFYVLPRYEVNQLHSKYQGEEFRDKVRDNWAFHQPSGSMVRQETLAGEHWVGDIGLECDVTVTSADGELLLNLVEGGVNYGCRIDIATGQAKLEINRGQTEFVSDDGAQRVQFPTGNTAVRGPGTYHILLTNCNDEMLLWVNDALVKFDGPTTYENRPDNAPQWSLADPGDMAPIGIGSLKAAFTVQNMKVLRDVYYIASTHGHNDDYQLPYDTTEQRFAEISRALRDPQTWPTTQVFASRRHVGVQLGPDQFFPLGDNSPASADARSWGDEPYVSRELLIGKALLIYWPHAWNRPVPFTPNIQRMGIIH